MYPPDEAALLERVVHPAKTKALIHIMYIYIYIERESDVYIYIYIYVYI